MDGTVRRGTLTTSEAAVMLGVSQRTVVRLCDHGELRAARLSKRGRRRIQPADVLELAASANSQTREPV